MYHNLPLSGCETCDEAPRKGGDDPQKSDLISTLARVGLPIFIALQLITGGLAALALLVLCCTCVGLVYWRLGFFDAPFD
jgi:hypothetical protein